MKTLGSAQKIRVGRVFFRPKFACISRWNYFHMVGGWFWVHFIFFQIVWFKSAWKPRLLSQ